MWGALRVFDEKQADTREWWAILFRGSRNDAWREVAEGGPGLRRFAGQYLIFDCVFPPRDGNHENTSKHVRRRRAKGGGGHACGAWRAYNIK